MYHYLYKSFTYLCNASAVLFMLSIAIDPIGDLLGLTTHSGAIAAATLMACGILLERLTCKLMIAEAWRSSMDCDLDQLMDKVYEEEKIRRRKEGKSV